jgi:hypothetical protein
MPDARKNSPSNPSRRASLGAGTALLGANLVSVAAAPRALADLADLSPPAKSPATPPPGYNISFVLVDQEHCFDQRPFPVPGREYAQSGAGRQGRKRADDGLKRDIDRTDRRRGRRGRPKVPAVTIRLLVPAAALTIRWP